MSNKTIIIIGAVLLQVVAVVTLIIGNGVSVFAGLVIVADLIALYWLPTFVAWRRQNNIMAVAVVNGFFGWSLIGWVVALVMAVNEKRATTVVINNSNSQG
jgi:membrane protease YdiL (CAAX protease family)